MFNITNDPDVSAGDMDLMRSITFLLKDTNSEFYLGFGGIGDFLLLAAVCYHNPKAKVIFFVNSGSRQFIENMAGVLGINILIFNNILDRKIAGYIYKAVVSHHKFKMSAHLPEWLDFYRWVDVDVYTPRIIPYFPFIDIFGVSPTNGKKIIGLCPSGSIRSRHPQRHLTKKEYKKIIDLYLELGNSIYTFGSRSDLSYYGVYDDPHCYFLTNESKINHQGQYLKISIQNFFKHINSCDEIVSMDTWLKTYSLMTGIPTIIIQSRWERRNLPYGKSESDLIFLNRSIWPEIKHISYKKILADLKFQKSLQQDQ